MTTPQTIEAEGSDSGAIARAMVRLFALVVIVAPLAVALYDLIRGIRTESTPESPAIPWVTLVSFAKTVLWAGIIGGLAAAFGSPLAWCCRSTRSRWRWTLVLPMFVPSTLAYVGWGSLRAPITPFAEWMAAKVAVGWTWLPSAFDGTLAVVGLAFWSAPLAAMVQAAWLRGIDDDTLEAFRLDCTPLRRKIELARLSMPSLLGSAWIVGVLMIGTAIPLHLAQVPTAAVNLWAALDVMPSDEHWRVWVAAWPLIILAAGLAWGVSCWARVDRTGGTAPSRCETGASVATMSLAALLLTVSVVMPIVLAARGIRTASALSTWWRLNREAVTASTIESLVVGVLAVGVGLAAWCAMACCLRRESRGMVGAFGFVVAAILPGVVIGSAVSRVWNLPFVPIELGETIWPLVAAHAARFGFIAILTAIVVAKAEPRVLRDSRLLDGADTPAGWFHACLPGFEPVWLIVGSLVAALCVQDIEAAVIVQPPGVPSLARKLLSDMHFFRTEELGVGMLVSVAIGLMFAGVASALSLGIRTLRRA